MLKFISASDTHTLYHRQELMGVLSVIHSKPITYIHAPMGYGKTVAAREYLKSQKAAPCWISVLTRDQEVFWRDFCSVLGNRLPEQAATIEDLKTLGYPSDPAKLDVARGILGSLCFPAGTVLVIDDIHFLPESEGRQFFRLCLLLVRQGGFPHIVLISRHSPDREFAEARLKGIATEIGPSFLALTREEIQTYFEQCGLTLTDTDSAKLLQATGGWISALYLYLLHYTQQGQLAAPSELSDLLASQVYDQLGDEAQSLLTLLSPLENFTVPQAEVFDKNAETVLANVLHRNAFVRFDQTTASYIPHALFREFLLDRFGNLPKERQQETCLSHARWLISHNELRKGIKILGKVNSTEALELLNSIVDRLPVTEGNGLLLALFQSFQPELVDRYPGVMFRYAMAALSARDIRILSDLLGRLGRYCASLPEDDPEANGWRGEMELLVSVTKFNDIEGMSAHHRRAAIFFSKAGVERSRLFGQDPWTLGSPSVLYMYHREGVPLKESLAQMRECLPYYSRLTGMHGAGAEDVMLAEAQYHAGEFKSAEIISHQALSATREHGQIGLELCAHFLLVRLSLLRGEYDRAMSRMETMRKRVEEEKATSLLRTLDMCTGFLHAQLHRPGKIPGWLLHGGEDNIYAFAGGGSYLTLGSALLLAGEHAEIVGRFSRLLREGPFARNLLFTIYANIFIAAANTGLKRWAEADTTLMTALELALPDRIYMPFVTNAAYLPQLKSLKDHERYGSGIRRILRLSASYEKARNNIQARFFSEDRPPLTPRERELVRLAMSGMTNKEIADALGLAPNSVKRYFATLHKKLGISSRDQLKRYFAEENGGKL